MARSLVKNDKYISGIRQTALGRRRAKDRQCLKSERILLRKHGIQRYHEKRVKEVAIAYGFCNAVQVAKDLLEVILEGA